MTEILNSKSWFDIKTKVPSYEEEVITDKSDDISTQSYYDRWSQKAKADEPDVDFVDHGDSRANAAGPITDSSPSPKTCNYYGQWSSKYETDMVVSNYNGPRHVVEAFVGLGLDRNVRLLDILAGSGLVAQLLRPHGYVNVDAIDGSKDMLALAQEKGLYKNVVISLLGGQHKAPIEDETYDVLIASGSFGPGHLYSDVFPDLIRMTKKGGIIIWSMRNDYGATSERFASFESDVEALVSRGLWRHYKPRKDIEQYLLGSDGYVYTMQKM